MINAFSKVHVKLRDCKEDIKLLDDKLEKLDDCGTEVEMEDDDAKMQYAFA